MPNLCKDLSKRSVYDTKNEFFVIEFYRICRNTIFSKFENEKLLKVISYKFCRFCGICILF